MREILTETNLETTAIKAMESFHADIVNEVKAAVQGNKIVVIGMGTNPFCKKACKLLAAKGLPYKYIEYGSYTSKWKERLAIKLWSGWPTFPQVFMDGKLVGGFTDLQAKLGR